MLFQNWFNVMGKADGLEIPVRKNMPNELKKQLFAQKKYLS